jgi:hypothetical protein
VNETLEETWTRNIKYREQEVQEKNMRELDEETRTINLMRTLEAEI